MHVIQSLSLSSFLLVFWDGTPFFSLQYHYGIEAYLSILKIRRISFSDSSHSVTVHTILLMLLGIVVLTILYSECLRFSM